IPLNPSSVRFGFCKGKKGRPRGDVVGSATGPLTKSHSFFYFFSVLRRISEYNYLTENVSVNKPDEADP
ncbi:MAG: hypothetical protein MUO52_07080, partial [Desulfobacterales bacterium]|nr:hypothetical protein [Desulfobacterales bacterium]